MRITSALLFTIAVLLTSCDVRSTSLAPSAVLGDTGKYDGQRITVTGMVSDFRAKISRRGNAYETYKLCDPHACLKVFAYGNSPQNDGATVTRTGHFWTVRHVGRDTFYNELDVDD